MPKTKVKGDTTTGKVIEFQASKNRPKVEPPEHMKMTNEEKIYWSAIIDARAEDTWFDADLQMSVTLARLRCEIERMQKLVRKKPVTPDGKVNPLHPVILKMLAQEKVIAAKLFVDASARLGRARETGAYTERLRQQEKKGAATKGEVYGGIDLDALDAGASDD